MRPSRDIAFAMPCRAVPFSGHCIRKALSGSASRGDEEGTVAPDGAAKAPTNGRVMPKACLWHDAARLQE